MSWAAGRAYVSSITESRNFFFLSLLNHNTIIATACNLFFDSKPQRGENLLNVSFHYLSFRQLQPQARPLLLLAQADRR